MCADASTARAWLLGLGLAVLGCDPGPSVTAEPSEPAAIEPSSVPGDRCVRFAGEPTDPELHGLARAHAVRCCPSDYGFDPQLARDVCGFAEYLGESEELACVHRFRADDGQLHELRISPILDLELERAVALHEQSTEPAVAPQGLPELRWSAVEGRRWAFVPGWSIVRRLGWDEATCAPDRMLPVLARMRAAANDPAAAVVLPRLHEQTASETPPAESLLARPLAEPQAERSYPLPRSAEELIDDLLRAAITDDPEAFAALLEPDARIGLPDRRQLGARAVLPDPKPAMHQLRDAAARFPIDTPLRCPSLDRRVEPQVARGEAMMWCFFISDDGLDLLAFGLRGRALETDADARVAYLGVFPIRPRAILSVPGEPPSPPVVPMPELVCGDPHAREYPGVCPEPEPTSDEDDSAQP
jgi:hypothetical protein